MAPLFGNLLLQEGGLLFRDDYDRPDGPLEAPYELFFGTDRGLVRIEGGVLISEVDPMLDPSTDFWSLPLPVLPNGATIQSRIRVGKPINTHGIYISFGDFVTNYWLGHRSPPWWGVDTEYFLILDTFGPDTSQMDAAGEPVIPEGAEVVFALTPLEREGGSPGNVDRAIGRILYDGQIYGLEVVRVHATERFDMPDWWWVTGDSDVAAEPDESGIHHFLVEKGHTVQVHGVPDGSRLRLGDVLGDPSVGGTAEIPTLALVWPYPTLELLDPEGGVASTYEADDFYGGAEFDFEATFDPELEEDELLGSPGQRLVLGLAGEGSMWYYRNRSRDGEDLILSRAQTRETAPFGIGTEAVFSNLYFTVDGFGVLGDLTLTPIVDGVERLDAARTVRLMNEGREPFTRRYELALYEGFTVGVGEVGRRLLRGTWFRLRVELSDEFGAGRVRVGGFELECEPVVHAFPDPFFAQENVLARSAPATVRLFLGTAGSPALLQYGVSGRDEGVPIPVLSRTRALAIDGAGGEAVFPRLSLPLYRYNLEAGSLEVVPIVDGVELPSHVLSFDPVARPVREVVHLHLYRPQMVGGVEVSRAEPRGAWIQFELRASEAFVDGTLRVGSPELEVERVTETEEALV